MSLFQCVKCFLPVLILPWIIASATGQSVSGTVYVDENKNGTLDQDEYGLEGVLVSNQVDVTVTDSEGRYELELVPGQSLMIVKPSGYDAPVNKFLVPQFSYEHEPEGSPAGLKYGGMNPTGSLPETIDFALYRSNADSSFKAIIVGDPQPRDDAELSYIRDTFINQASSEEGRFTMILGDVMYDDLSLFNRHKQLISKTGKPTWHVVGNHDIDYDAENNRHARDTYKRHFGPNYYAFSEGEVTYLVLDNVDYQGYDDGRPVYQGRIWGNQLTWIENLLPHIPENHLLVIATHIPLYAWGGETANVNTNNREDLFDLLKTRKKLLSVSGHLHMTYHHFLNEEAGWTGNALFHHLVATTVAGTWWGGFPDINGIPTTTQRDGNPNGYHLFSFNGSDYEERLVGLGRPDDFQLQVEYPAGNVSTDSLPEKLIVNVFNGTLRNEVHYRLNDGDWKSMENVPQSSPFYQRLLDEFDDYWSDNLTAIPTNHIWESNLELPNTPQTVRIDVKTTDQYGHKWTTSKVVEISE